MKKTYVIDTNVFIDSPEDCIKILRNGEENKVVIPYHVLMELDKLKKDDRIGHLVYAAIESIIENKENIQIIYNSKSKTKFSETVDNKILDEIKESDLDDPILITNDWIFQLVAGLEDIKSEDFFKSYPFKCESEKYTGFVTDLEDVIPNSFTWCEGKPLYIKNKNDIREITHLNKPWNITPRTPYQNLAIELILDPTINLISIQSPAGSGKTFISLACALYFLLEKKTYEKIYVFKPCAKVGESLGYLPGEIDDKMKYPIKHISDLIIKLKKIRECGKIISKTKEDGTLVYDKNKFEVYPIEYIRGMNIDNAFVIVDEVQNLSREEVRSLLSRMGENTKCICLGDVRQIDNKRLNTYNNGLNWIVKFMKGMIDYGHILLKTNRSRGPICDMVLKSGL